MGGHVLDTCVVIDLKAAGLLHVAARNLARPVVGFLAAHEINELGSHREELRRYGVHVDGLPGAAMARISAVRAERPALSIYDVEAALVAEARHAVLLTNESSLRRLAADLDLPVHGSLWVIRTLVDRTIVDPPGGLSALTRLCQANRRLPAGECHRLRAELQWRAASRGV